MQLCALPVGRVRDNLTRPLLRRFSYIGVKAHISFNHEQNRRPFASTSSICLSQADRHQQVVCYRIRDCKERARLVLQELVGAPSQRGGFPPSPNCELIGTSLLADASDGVRCLLELHDKAYRFLHLLHTTILLPRDVVNDTDDFPEFLLHCFRRSNGSVLHEDTDLRMSDAVIVDGFTEWVETSLLSAGRFVSYVEVLQLVGSFVRYHKGVRWGTQASADEWQRKGYLLHPWHDTYCPSSRSEQMPYVHLLQWLMRTKQTGLRDHRRCGMSAAEEGRARGVPPLSSTARDDAMQAWCATEEFLPPSWRTEGGGSVGCGFKALDCGCHSGYMTELLLRAGAREVLGVDVSSQSLGSAEATLREHLRERRSSAHSGKKIQFVRCDLLPEKNGTLGQAKGVFEGEKGGVLTSAGEKRRRAAQQHRVPDGGQDLKHDTEVGGPFDLLVFHPPLQPLFPLWPLFHDPHESVDQLAYACGRRHPHCCLSALHGFLQTLLQKPCNDRGRNQRVQPTEQRGHVIPIVKELGYVAFILPRTFDTRSLLQRTSTSSVVNNFGAHSSDSLTSFVPLSDLVTATLEGTYELVLKRPHTLAPLMNRMEPVYRSASAFIRAFVSPSHRSRVEQEINEFYTSCQAIDLIVLRKLPGRGICEAKRDDPDMRMVPLREIDHLAYEESFEFGEYIPSEGPPLAHHWTEMTPSYSYLEEEFFGDAGGEVKAARQQNANFLAVGHPLAHAPRMLVGTVRSGTEDCQTREGSVQGFGSLFAKELKRKRSGRMRKMSLTPLEKQEWYISEKLVKSEAAKVDLMNELSRFNLKDYD